MKPKKVFNKNGSYRWLINSRDPQGRQIKHRFEKLSEAETVLANVKVQAFDDKAVASITYRQIELFRSVKISVPTWCGKQRSPARINRELSILRHIFNRAVTWGKLEINPFSRGDSLFL